MSDEKKKRYNTQDLLSLNMDRLKEYMKRMEKETAKTDGMAVFEVPSRPAKGTTRIGKTPSSCRILALFKDPFHFVEIVNTNDRRPKTQRFTFERAADFGDAMNRLRKQTYDMILLSPMEQSVPDVESVFSPADFSLILRGQMPSRDVYFLAKKRWFVVAMVEGATNQEKVDNFRQLKTDYKRVPILYLTPDVNDPAAKVMASIQKTRVIPLQAKKLDPLFNNLDQIALSGG